MRLSLYRLRYRAFATAGFRHQYGDNSTFLGPLSFFGVQSVRHKAGFPLLLERLGQLAARLRAIALFGPVFLAACGPDETISGFADPGATYVLQDIDGEAIAARVTITFPAQGEVAGDGPCNAYRATQTAPYPWFALGSVASTRRACPDLALEQHYLATLGRVTLAEVSGPVLILSTADGPALVYQSE